MRGTLTDTSSSPVAVTGATGFIGGVLVTQLAALHGQGAVKALVRSAARCPDPVSTNCTLVVGNLEDEAALEKLVTGVDVLYHAAAKLGKEDAAASSRVNVDGTERLARAAKAAGVRRLVYLSSVSVYAATRLRGGIITERDLPTDIAHLNPYSRTKYQGELRLRELAAKGESPPVTIVRPTNVYGPGGRSWVDDWLRRLGTVPIVPGGNIPIDLVHVDDVAAGIILAGTAPRGENEIFHLGHETVLLGEYLTALGKAFGIKAHRLPSLIDWALRHGIEKVGRAKSREVRSLSLATPRFYPADKAREALGYDPRVTMREGLARLARGYQKGASRER